MMTATMGRVVVRKAKREDCKEIMRLINELAEFEKLSEHVKINSSDLEQDGFEAEFPRFGCYVAEMHAESKELCRSDTLSTCGVNVGQETEQHTRLVGYALYFPRYSTWSGVSMHMEDLYVSPCCRRQGTGRALIAQVAKECVSLGCKRLDFDVLNWNPAREFYKKLGAVNLTEDEGWHHYRLTGEALQHLGSCDTC